MLVAFVTPGDTGPLGGDAGQAFDRSGRGVIIVRNAGPRQHADDQLAACGACVGDCDRGLHAKRVSRPRFAFGEAFHFGRVPRYSRATSLVPVVQGQSPHRHRATVRSWELGGFGCTLGFRSLSGRYACARPIDVLQEAGWNRSQHEGLPAIGA